MRDSYRASPLHIWHSGALPSYIISNAGTAYRYARVMTGWLRDLRTLHPSHQQQTVTVLELGCATGRLTFHLLQALIRLMPQSSAWDGVRLRYLATDISEERLEILRQGGRFDTFVADGTLYFSTYDVVHDAVPVQVASGPFVVIANYLFDSLPTDAFLARNGHLYEILLEDTPRSCDERHWHIGQAPIDAQHYRNTWLDALLERQAGGAERTFGFPVAALTALQRLSAAAQAPWLLLMADKQEDAETPECLMPQLERHGPNIFSVPVNTRVLSQAMEAMQGRLLETKQGGEVVTFCAGTAGTATVPMRETCLAFQEQFEDASVAADLYLSARLQSAPETLLLTDLLALLHRQHWDPGMWQSMFPFFLRAVEHMPSVLRPAVIASMRTLAERYYPNSNDELDLPFLCGCILLQMGEAEPAVELLRASSTSFGASPLRTFQLARALREVGHLEEALALFASVAAADPDLCDQVRLLGLHNAPQLSVAAIMEAVQWQLALRSTGMPATWTAVPM